MCSSIVDKCYDQMPSCAHTLHEAKFHWNLNFDISLTVNLLNLNSAHYEPFRSFALLIHRTEIQKLIITNSVNLSHDLPVM